MGNRYYDVAFLCGLDFSEDGRSCAFSDLDLDGDLDLLVNTLQGFRVFKNNLPPSNHSVAVKLAGYPGALHGAKITLQQETNKQIRFFIPTPGFLTQVEPSFYFGLGSSQATCRVKIQWPDKKVSIHEVQPNGLWLTRYGGGTQLAASFTHRLSDKSGSSRWSKTIKELPWPGFFQPARNSYSNIVESPKLGLLINENSESGPALSSFPENYPKTRALVKFIKQVSFPVKEPTFILIDSHRRILHSMSGTTQDSHLALTFTPYFENRPKYALLPYFNGLWIVPPTENSKDTTHFYRWMMNRFPGSFHVKRSFFHHLFRSNETAQLKKILEREITNFPEPQWLLWRNELEKSHHPAAHTEQR